MLAESLSFFKFKNSRLRHCTGVTRESQPFIRPIRHGYCSDLISPPLHNSHYWAAAVGVDAGWMWGRVRDFKKNDILILGKSLGNKFLHLFFFGHGEVYDNFYSSLWLLNDRKKRISVSLIGLHLAKTWSNIETFQDWLLIVILDQLLLLNGTLVASSHTLWHDMKPLRSSPVLTQRDGITEAHMKSDILKIHSSWKWQVVPYWWSAHRCW